MDISQIYRPIEKEIKEIEDILAACLKESKNKSILRLCGFLLESPGKRIRPALVIFSSKACMSSQTSALGPHLPAIAGAIELIHMASLVHDDVIDHSHLRHNKTTVNSKWGDDVSIALGDYLFSRAFELISKYGNRDILQCVSSATKTMCEGELLQVSDRDNIDLLKERYMLIIKKKTAMFFAASCHAGALVSNGRKGLQRALREYGSNFGIAFQIVDDYLDLIGEEKDMGKMPGQDLGVGEITLPLLNLLECVTEAEREQLRRLLSMKDDKDVLRRIRTGIFNRDIEHKTKDTASFYTNLAKEKINKLSDSCYKEGLLNLADFIMQKGFK